MEDSKAKSCELDQVKSIFEIEEISIGEAKDGKIQFLQNKGGCEIRGT